MSKFEKGAKPGPGRPKGSKERKYLNLKFWFDLLETELNRKIQITRKTKDGLYVDSWETTAVDPNTRAQLFLNAMKMLTSKMKQLPTTPSDSVDNAEESMRILEGLEKGTNDAKTVVDPSSIQKPL